MGSDLLTVSVTDEDVSLSADDYMTLEKYDSIAGVAPYLTVSSTARCGSNYTTVSAIGVTQEYMDVAGLTLEFRPRHRGLRSGMANLLGGDRHGGRGVNCLKVTTSSAKPLR